MILQENSLHPDWIHSKKEEFHADPIIIEKVVRALILLEALKVSELEFIFNYSIHLIDTLGFCGLAHPVI